MKKFPKKTISMGTDDPFYKIMYAGGEAILKLIGVKSPGGYQPKAIVLKEKKLYPDIIAMPKDEGDRVFIEFQGYKDIMIRYSVAAKMAAFCTREKHTGSVLGAIIYTDKQFQDAALPLDMKSVSGDFRITGHFKEIVLSEYTEQQLTAIDPRLIVLAPFTVSKTMKKEKFVTACHKWTETIAKVYDENTRNESLEILGLFI